MVSSAQLLDPRGLLGHQLGLLAAQSAGVPSALAVHSGGLGWAARIGGERASYKQGSVFSAVRSYLPLLKPEAPSHSSEAVCVPL